jgi:chromosome segregation ATPase
MNTTNPTNYFENVAVPLLQRKCQELFNAHMALETAIHIEVAKSRDIMEELSKVKAAQSSSATDVLRLTKDLEEANTRAAKAENDCRNTQITLNDTGNALSAAQNRITSLEGELVASRKAIEVLQEELQTTKADLEKTQKEFTTLNAVKVATAPNRNLKSKVIEPTDDF